MIFVTSIFNLPFLILIWLIEAYLFLAAARLILVWIPGGRQSRFYDQVKVLTDRLPNLVCRHLLKAGSETVPSWLPWTIAISLLCLIRQVLVWIVLT